MARRLKVFFAQIGFYDTVVAAPSKAAALRAWGTRQDLFAYGQARSDDPKAEQAALASPEVPLRRPVGTDGPFLLEPEGTPRAPGLEVKDASTRLTKKAPALGKPPADRSLLDAAEKFLKELDAKRKEEEAILRERQVQLDADRSAAQTTYLEDRKRATEQIVKTRAAFRDAGGRG